MDYFTKNRLLFWAVAILIVLNVIGLISLWTRPSRPRGAALRLGPDDGGKIMEERLRLGPDQVEAFEQIRRVHFERTRPIVENMHYIRLELVAETFRPDLDRERVETLLAELGTEQAEFDRLLFEHFEELKGACRPEQIDRLKQLFAELMEMKRAGGHGQRPTPRHDRPPPRRR